ncbi:hypothetical protein MLD38_028944 [Melastoma candidum]|uniref:Uncharacterized protein n=1 Tax=Melastoma candidum TaxID=119954 RepID=A0ACB9N2K9_9MYRT|nr:hypothetical protein MLD38_028944 [Melastoma candidum]
MPAMTSRTSLSAEKESGDEPKKRGLLCTLLLWSSLALVLSLLLAALFLAFLFLIYRPRLPAFYVSSLSVTSLDVSAVSASVYSGFDLTVTARNSNSKLRFEYGDPMSISVVVGGVDVADGGFPGFVHRKKTTAVLRASVGSGGQKQVTGDEVTAVEAGVRSGVATAEVRIDGTVRALFGNLRSPAMVLRVTCKGLQVSIPGNGQLASASAGGKCEVKFKGKVGKLTV